MYIRPEALISTREQMDLVIYTDGASRGNPGKAAIGFSIQSSGKKLMEHSEYIGRETNNAAEYKAIIKALENARNFSKGNVKLISDSSLVVNQLNGNWKIKKEHLKRLYSEAKEQEKSFRRVDYMHAPRETTGIARVDRMINKELDRH